jgi:alanine dehydrogenase
MKTILLSRKDIEKLLTMADCMEALEKAFVDLTEGRAEMPQRTPITVPDHGGVALFMPAYLKGMGALGAKVVTVYKDNLAKRQLPVVLGTIILLDDETGFPVAIMDGGFITAMRTGAVSGVATKYMARDDAKVGMIFGTGVQAYTQVLAMCEARDFDKIIAYSIDPEDKKLDFKQRVEAATGVIVEIADSPEAAVGEADVVTLATSAKDPIIHVDWFKPGTHINGIGSHAPGMRECDEGTVCDAKIVCDLVSACQAEAGDFIIPAAEGKFSWDSVRGSLGEVISGKINGRENDDEITLFKSVGLAIQDMSTARAVYEKALREGAGTEFEF